MTRYLTGLLTMIAAGVLLIAYALLAPRAQASLGAQPAMMVAPAATAGTMSVPSGQMVTGTPCYDAGYAMPVGSTFMRPAVAREVVYEPAPVRTVAARVPRRVGRTTVRSSRRDWTKTAMVIGGSSAAGAGVGAMFGGKKGALIGAALGGGASTIYETTKR